MGLFGALSSGVSGLTAQSSAISAIADNITNVNTVGYKGVQVNFQTLVTQQTSATFFSAGGVQSRPRIDTGIQGLLQSSTSQTDIAISGQGFFVVNEAASPTISDEFLFTRAGQFFQDDNGFLRNTAGFFLQGFPTNAQGEIVPNNGDILTSNVNVISTDFLTTINLSRVGGTASATTNIGIGANLPANATTGQTHRTDVQFFNTLGNSNNIGFIYESTGRDNQWDLNIEPPQNSTTLALENVSGGITSIYGSYGQLEFNDRPADGSSVIIDGITYQFDQSTFTTVAASGTNAISITQNGAATADTITAAVNGTFSNVNVGDTIDLAGFPLSTDTTVTVTAVSTDGTTITVADNANLATEAGVTNGGTLTLNSNGLESATLRIVDVSANTTTSQDVSSLVNAVIAADSDYDTTNQRIGTAPSSATTILFTEDGADNIVVDPRGLLTSSGAPAVNQEAVFTVNQVSSQFARTTQFEFQAEPANGETITINGTTYTFLTAEPADANGLDTNVRITGNLADTLADLEAAIEGQDPQFASGASTVRLRAANQEAIVGTPTNNTLVLSALDSGSYDVSFSSTFTGAPTTVNRTSPSTIPLGAANPTAVDVSNAINFSSTGLPSAFNVSQIRLEGLTDGAANFDGDSANTDLLQLDFGSVGVADGLTQFGNEFTPVFISQDGSQFGTFAGVTISEDGLVTALFDNGETVPVFQIPVATFTNVNELGARTGNVFNATEASGDPTLRFANSGPAGAVVQASLEASTVDIGQEFTDMIVVQRAFSAATRIITTADEMLDELVRIR